MSNILFNSFQCQNGLYLIQYLKHIEIRIISVIRTLILNSTTTWIFTVRLLRTLFFFKSCIFLFFSDCNTCKNESSKIEQCIPDMSNLMQRNWVPVLKSRLKIMVYIELYEEQQDLYRLWDFSEIQSYVNVLASTQIEPWYHQLLRGILKIRYDKQSVTINLA